MFYSKWCIWQKESKQIPLNSVINSSDPALKHLLNPADKILSVAKSSFASRNSADKLPLPDCE
jgi:hypothetical protein